MKRKNNIDYCKDLWSPALRVGRTDSRFINMPLIRYIRRGNIVYASYADDLAVELSTDHGSQLRLLFLKVKHFFRKWIK